MPSLVKFTILLSSGFALSVYAFHNSLSKRVHHEHSQGAFPNTAKNKFTSIPDTISADEYHCIHDRALCRVPRRDLPLQSRPDLFVLLLRRNMIAFGRFPQAYMLRLMITPEKRQTFSPSHIQSLDFKLGDVVNGIYRVCERRESDVVYQIDAQGPIDGRLAIRCWEEGDEAIFCSETIMWTKKATENEKQAKLPLERPLLRFLHELAAWWLLDSGARYLMGLKESSQEAESGK